MATHSLRDRFFSPPVARAITSPSAIVAAGVGVAVGIVATFATGGLVVPLAGLIGGLAGYGGRVAMAIPRSDSGVRVDPFGVNEPWRHAVQDALKARRRFSEAIKTFQAGPLKDSLSNIGDRIDEAVEQCWQVAQQGQLVSDARKRIDDREIAWELQQAAAQIPAGGEASPTQAKTIASLRAQQASAERMDALTRSTYEELGLLNARLDETVTQAIELSVTNRTSGLAPVGDSVEDIVDSLTALRRAMATVDEPSPQVLDVSGPGGEEPEQRQQDPPGGSQATPGS